MNPLRVSLAALLFTASVHATPLAPGQTVVPTAAATSPLFSGVITALTGLQGFSVAGGGATFSGTTEEWVVRNYFENPFGFTALTFVIQCSVTGGFQAGGAPAVITSMSLAGLSSFSVDVTYFLQNGSEAIPGTAGRATNGDVTFNFPVNIQIGQTSALLIINTNATFFNGTNFSPNAMTVTDALTATAPGFSPSAVPEAGANSALLLAIAFGVLFCAPGKDMRHKTA